MKSVVLLSSGLDSTVNLYQAQKETHVQLAITFDYGQKAAEKEIFCSQRITENLKIPHQIVSLPFFKEWKGSSLLNQEKEIPTTLVQIDNLESSEESARSVWVPNRNGIFLNIAAGFAEALGADIIIPGFNKEEAQTFPDNSNEFLKSLDHSFSFSTANHVKTKCYTTTLNKTEIVQHGELLNVDWRLIWPCYFAYDQWCGQCESCQRSHRAFFSFPSVYERIRSCFKHNGFQKK